MDEDNSQERKRIRNKPPIRILIENFLTGKREASFQDIYSYIQKQDIKLVSKTPRNSIFSIVTRATNIERVGSGKYRLKSTKK